MLGVDDFLYSMHVRAPEVAFVFGPKCHFRLGVCSVQRIARLGQVMKVATQWANLIKFEICLYGLLFRRLAA